MPFYEYQCKNCGHDLEAMQKFSDPPLKKCPDCGKSQLQRLMSAPVFRLKGGGWYETDFKGDKENQQNLAYRPEAEAAKESPTDAAKETAKEGAAAGAEAKGNGKADATPAKEAATKDTPAAKPAEKTPAESTKKVASGAGKSSLRGRTAARGKPPVRRPIKKPAPKAKRRR